MTQKTTNPLGAVMPIKTLTSNRLCKIFSVIILPKRELQEIKFMFYKEFFCVLQQIVVFWINTFYEYTLKRKIWNFFSAYGKKRLS